MVIGFSVSQKGLARSDGREIDLIKDRSKPIILESLGSINLERYQEELKYISKFFDF